MKKSYGIQKKETLGKKISNIVFKVLVGVAVLIFCYIAYDKVDFSTNSISFTSKQKNDSRNAYVPSELKWNDPFKGIENIPDKNAKKSDSEGSNSGFKYQGFNK